jgi:regulatory protein
MPLITNMSMGRGKPERFIVTLDVDQEFVFAPEIVLKYGFFIGKELSDETLFEILHENSMRLAKDQALRYLSIRPHSRLELVRKMRDKGYHYKIINLALDDLEKLDLVSDHQFAKLFIQNELRLRPVGKMLLKQKLAYRGINNEVCDSLIAEFYPEELEIELVHQVAEKYIRSHPRFKGRKLLEKLSLYLNGKGFNWEHIQQILEKKFDLE